jgi:hypothetical protein
MPQQHLGVAVEQPTPQQHWQAAGLPSLLQAKSARDIAARALAAEEAVMPPEPAPSEPATSTSPSRTPSTRVAEGGAAWGRPPWADQQQQGAGGSGPQAGAQWGGAGGGGSFIRSRPSDVAHDKFVRAHGIDRDSILQRAHAAEAAAAAAQDSDQVSTGGGRLPNTCLTRVGQPHPRHRDLTPTILNHTHTTPCFGHNDGGHVVLH